MGEASDWVPKRVIPWVPNPTTTLFTQSIALRVNHQPASGSIAALHLGGLRLWSQLNLKSCFHD